MSGADLANLLNEARFERAWSSGSCLPQSFPPYGGIYTRDISWEYMGYNGNWDQQNEVFRVFPKSWKNPIKSSKLLQFFFLNRVFGGFGVKKTQYYRKGKSLSAAGWWRGWYSFWRGIIYVYNNNSN
jgi:hypothetical protein